MDFYLNLAAIITSTPEKARTLVREFNTDNESFFEGYFNRLPTAKLARNTRKNNNANATLFINNVNAGKGAFGVLSRNRTLPYVYKTVANQEPRLKFLKSIFREVIIQTLLQCDSLYGKHICEIYKLYRNGKDCIIKMERLNTTLYDYVRRTNDMFKANPELHNRLVQAYLLKLFNILNHFRNMYGFKHNDLHEMNIMTNSVDIMEIKLIDFGFSSIHFATIHIDSGNGLPDCYNITLSVMQHVKNITPRFAALLKSITDKVDESTPITKYIELLSDRKTK